MTRIRGALWTLRPLGLLLCVLAVVLHAAAASAHLIRIGDDYFGAHDPFPIEMTLEQGQSRDFEVIDVGGCEATVTVTPAAAPLSVDPLTSTVPVVSQTFTVSAGLDPPLDAPVVIPVEVGWIGRDAGDPFGECTEIAHAEILVEVRPPLPSLSLDVRDVSFHQLDWFDSEGALSEPDSRWGRVDYTYDADPNTHHYLSLSASVFDEAPVWLIENLPLFAESDPNLATASESAYFDLGDLGFESGDDVVEIDWALRVEPAVQLGPPDPTPHSAPVEPAERNDCGLPIGGNADGLAPPGAPEPIRVRAGAQPVNGRRDIRAVQERGNACMAGAFARSLDWLNREHELGIDADAQAIYDELIDAGVSDHTVTDDRNGLAAEWIRLKSEWSRTVPNRPIVTKVWNGPGAYEIPEGIEESRGDFEQWLRGEIPTEDVELAYRNAERAHIVTLVDVWDADDHIGVAYRDDAEQGRPDAGDTRILRGRILRLDGGGYAFQARSNEIHLAVSESVEEEPPAPCVCALERLTPTSRNAQLRNTDAAGAGSTRELQVFLQARLQGESCPAELRKDIRLEVLPEGATTPFLDETEQTRLRPRRWTRVRWDVELGPAACPDTEPDRRGRRSGALGYRVTCDATESVAETRIRCAP